MLKNVAGQNITALLLDTDGAAVTTGTTTVYVTGDAGTQTSMGTATHEGNGEWSIDVTQAESNYDDIGFTWTNAGAVTVHQHVFTDQSYDRLGAPAGASIAADISTVDGVVDSILVDTAEIGVAGAGLTEAGGTGDHLNAVVWNAAWDAEVQSEVTDALNAYDPPTNAEMEARTLVAASYFDPAADTVATVTTVTNQITAAAMADAVWDEAQADHVAAGSMGLIASETGDILVDTGTTIPATLTTIEGKVDTVDTVVDGIQTDLDNPTDGLGALKALIDALNDLSAAQVNSEVLDVLNTDTFGEPTGVPGATTTLVEKVGYLYMALRNKVTVTSTKKTFFDDGDAAEWEKDLSDDGTTYTETEGNAI